MLQTVSKPYITQTRELFHCHCKVKIPLSLGEQLIEQCFAILEETDLKYNSYREGSYFDRINQNAGEWIQVDDDCIKMLRILILISEITLGSYDITCMPLIRLWGFYRKTNNDVPSKADIVKTLEKVDYQSICINGNFVKINPGQEIITGSFIKAYAVDKAIAFLQKSGVTDAIINAGGSTIRCLNDEMHSDWKINIPDAFVPNEYSEQIPLINQCFSLSGFQNNKLVINGKTYCHILNSLTGFPVTTAQVGVFTHDAFLGDILSTALFTVDECEVENTVKKLRQHFEFNYFRIEENEKKTTYECF